eukprot:TRINITY_DN3632_c0_g1_i1.p1 TRINITY_DN3632_c0_g1~~TRINITY_DN3632_c0_g1_i1.p1  ORF type:complete len:114 (-),score=30.33 TRINITY_DN3632_c0_g1_i1:37-378(-)
MAHRGGGTPYTKPPPCWKRIWEGFKMGAQIGAIFGSLFGTFVGFRGGLRGKQLLVEVGKAAVTSGGAFGGFISIGTLLKCEDVIRKRQTTITSTYTDCSTCSMDITQDYEENQ